MLALRRYRANHAARPALDVRGAGAGGGGVAGRGLARIPRRHRPARPDRRPAVRGRIPVRGAGPALHHGLAHVGVPVHRPHLRRAGLALAVT
ncbi:hypothetical protein G6F59_015893 [Rhizopus arrhizus]|nr:hypothetical protein G6F59_015893 [Rhizopus arrhizus]